MMSIRIFFIARVSTLGQIGIRRPFFASSTDHSRLLQEAEVHCLSTTEANVHQYVMASGGMDTEMVQKVPQLHLARLFVTDNALHGAKVINRTLGSLEAVCGKLVDAALADIKESATARSTLHGLSDWVLEGFDDLSSTPHPATAILGRLTPEGANLVKVIASSNSDKDYYMEVKDVWELLAKEFIQQKLSPEAALYQSKRATLEAIEHGTDTSDFANTSGGSMALFRF